MIREGDFLLVFSEDAHEPGLAPGGVCGKVKMVVAEGVSGVGHFELYTSFIQ